MSLKKLYFSLEDKYFQFLENLEKKGINLFKIVDPLEKKGIPTFPVFSIVLLGIVVLILLLIFKPITTTSQDQLNITFFDEQNNLVANQEISFYLGTDKYTRRTDSQGYIKISNLQENNYLFSLEDPNYNLETESVSINLLEKRNYSINIQEKEKEIDKEIIFKKEDGTIIQEDFQAVLICSQNPSFDAGVLNVVEGRVVVRDVPTDCGMLVVESIRNKPASLEDYDISEQINLSPTTTIGEIYLKANQDEFGNLKVIVKDNETNAALSNIEVKVMTWDNFEVDVGTTNNNGVFVFDNLLVDNYVVIARDVSETPVYGAIIKQDYDSGKYSLAQLSKNTTSEIELKLNKDIVGFFNFKVVDKDILEIINNVDVKLYKNNNLISTATTDSQGKVLIPVSETIPYVVVFDHEDYIISTRTITPTTTQTNQQEIRLTKVDQQTMQGVFVSVVDTENKPIEFAKINVYEHPEKTKVTTLTADVRGQAAISNLVAEKTYYLEAKVKEYTGVSETFSVAIREPTNITIKLNIGEGTYDVSVLDSTQQPVSTKIKVFDALTNQEMTHKATTTNQEGNTLIRIRADKYVYFVIDNHDSKYVTKRYNVLANNTLKEEFILPRQPTTNEIKFLGLYDHSGKQVTSVSSGQTVVAKFLVNTIRPFSKIQAHIRTGQGVDCDNKTYSLEQDQLYIKQIKYSGNNVVGSTTFTPCTGESKDTVATTTRDAKWLNVVIDNPAVGSHLIESEIIITDNALGTLPLYYRVEFIEGTTVLRNPADQTLGTALTHSNKQATYAYAKQENIFTGASNFCENTLCYYFSVFDKSTNVSKNIVDKFTATENTDYSLSFNFNFNKPITNATMRITTQTSVDLEDYTITAIGSEVISGNNFNNIELGNIIQGDHINGTINLGIINDQTDYIRIEILSQGEIVFTKDVLFDIKPSKEMTVDIIPTVFVPFIQNNIIVGVEDTENKPIENAQVIIKHKNQTIEKGLTDKEGIFKFKLPAPNVGDIVEINIRKKEYKSINLKREVSKNIIIVKPEKIETQLNLSTESRKNINVDLRNPTVLPFAISNISHTIPQKYLDVEIVSNNNVIDAGEKINIDVKLGLTTEGFNLMTQQNIEGDIVVNLKDSVTNQTWPIRIPVNVRITFGNSVDNINCLEIIPGQIEIRTEPLSEQEMDLKIVNNCKVGIQDVSLGKINAKINLNGEKQSGDFIILVNNKPYPLSSTQNTQIFESFPVAAEANIKLRFKAYNIRQASTKPVIEFNTMRANTSGVDKIKGNLETTVVVNDYATCVAIPKDPIQVMFCGMTTQLGNFQNQFSYDPTTYSNPYQNMTNVGNPQYMSTLYNNPYPNQGYNQDILMHNYLSQQTQSQMGYSGTGMFGCPSTRIPVRNDCAEDVELEFVSDYGVTLKSDSTINVEKGKIEYVEVTGGQQLGTFNLGVYARPDSSVGYESTHVGNIPIQVLLPVEQIPDECIIISQKRFDFSSIIDHKPQTFTITNRCVADGWNIQSVRLRDLEALNFGDIRFWTIGEDASEEIKPLRTPERKNVGHEIHEIWTFRIQRSPEIKENIDTLTNLRTTQSTSQTITSTRLFFNSLGEGVKLEPILDISYNTPRLTQENHYETLELIDNLQWLGYLTGDERDIFSPEEKEDDLEKPISKEEITKKEENIILKTIKDTPTEIDLANLDGIITDKIDEKLDDTNIKLDVCLSPHLDKKEGITGENSYKTYGFDKLLFDWENITSETCDLGNNFCDQTQLFDSLQEKIKLLENEGNKINIEYKQDTTISFMKENNKIKENKAMRDIVVDISEEKYKSLKDSCNEITENDVDDCLTKIIDVLKEVPEDLRKYAIIDFELADDVLQEDLKEYIGNTGYYKYDDKYQITSYQFILNANDYYLTLDDAPSKFIDFLNMFYTSMDMYYGYALNPTIVNLKQFDDLENVYNTELIDKYNEMFLETTKINEVNNINVSKPGTYEIVYDYEKNQNVFIIDLTNIQNFTYNEINKNKYIENRFFYVPINPQIFRYSSEKKGEMPLLIPFGEEDNSQVIALPQNTTTATILENINDLTQWNQMQEGYLFKINNNFTYADLRPVHFLFNTRVLNYKLPNNYEDNINKGLFLDSKIQNMNHNNNTKLNTMTLTEKTEFMKTFFILNKSTRPTTFVFSDQSIVNINVNSQTTNDNYFVTTINHTTQNPFDDYIKIFNADNVYKNIDSIIKNINTKNICFTTTKDEIKIWTNPVKSIVFKKNAN
jgi:hypothetical protein